MTSKLAKGPDLTVGTRVLTGAGFTNKGEICFIGTTKFATGEWIGVRLDTPDGKNDGSVGGTRYFDAEPNYGTFVKRAQVKPDTARARAQLGAASPMGASSSGVSRTSTSSTGSRTSVAAAPAPATSPRASAPRTTPSAPGSPRASTGAAVGRKSIGGATSMLKGATRQASSSSGDGTADAPRVIKGGGRGPSTAPDAATAATATPQTSTAPVEPASPPSTLISIPSSSRLMMPTRSVKARAEGSSLSSVDRIKEKISAAAPEAALGDVPLSPRGAAVGDFSSPIARAEAAMATAAATTAAVAAVSGVTADPTATAPAPVEGFTTPFTTPYSATSSRAALEDAGGYQSTIKELQQEKDNLLVKVRLLENKLADQGSEDAAQQDNSSHVLELEEKIAVLEADNQRLLEQHQSMVDAVAAAEAEAKMFADEASAALAAAAEATATAAAADAAAQSDAAAASGNAEQRVLQLQEQLEDLQLQVESLKLDKETIQLDMETLEEQYLEWKREVEEAVEEMDIMSSVTSTAADEAATHRRSTVATAEGMTDGGHEGSTASAADAAAVIFQLREENEKFREALRRLNHVSIQDKSALHSLHIKANALEEEVLALRSYKQEAESSISELRQSVDAAHESAEMSEALALKNIHLQEELQQAQDAIQELEEAHELNEEIDQQQRSQIESDAQVIEMLNGSIDAYEEVIQQKDQELADYARMVERLKAANKTLKHEIHRLNVLRANASAESKQVEARLQELASLRSWQEVMAKDMSTLYEESMHTTLQKYKFQAIHSRYEAIFGSTALYKEENNLLSSEITYLTCLSSGFEATRCLSGALDLALDQESRTWVSSVTVRAAEGASSAASSAAASASFAQGPIVASALGRLYLLLLHSIYATLEANLNLYVDTSSAAAVAEGSSAMGQQAQAAQMMMKIKALYEKVVRVGGRAQQLCTDLMKDAQLKNEQSEDMGLEVLEDEQEIGGGDDDADDDMNALGMKPVPVSPGVHTDAAGNKIGVYVVAGKRTAAVNEILVSVNECTAQLVQLFQLSDRRSSWSDDAAPQGDAVALLGNRDLMRAPLPAPKKDSDSARFPILDVETHFLGLNTLCNMALQQAEAAKASAEDGRFGDERLATEAAAAAHVADMCVLLKSMRVDLKTGLYNLRSNQGHYSLQRGELADIYSSFTFLFEQVQESIKLSDGTESTDAADGAAAAAVAAENIGDGIFTLKLKMHDENTLSAIKTLVERVRKVNNSQGVLSHNNSSTIVALGMTVVMRYYPMLFMSTVSTVADPHQMSGLREQFRQLLEKYWALTSKGTNDLLAATYTASSASSLMRTDSAAADDEVSGSGSSSSSIAGSGVSIELAWKVRTTQYRDLVNEKLGDDAVTGSNLLAARNGPASAVAEVTMQLQNVMKDLDEKRDELRTAMNRCMELQAQVDTLAGKGGMKRKGSIVDSMQLKLEGSGTTEISPEMLTELRNEIATLEAALETTEKRAEELEMENKQLKLHGSHDVGDVPMPPSLGSFSGSITSSPAVANMSSKNLRRQSLMNISEAINNSAAEILVSPPRVPLSGGRPSRAGSTANIMAQLMEEANSNVPPSPSKATSPSPLPRQVSRMSSFNMSSAAAVALAQAAEASTAATSTAPPSAADEQHVQMLISELMHWKSMALKRLTASLLPLDIPPQLRKIYEELGSSAFMHGQEVDMEVGAMYSHKEVSNFTSLSKASEALVLSGFVNEAVPATGAEAAGDASAAADSKTPSASRAGGGLRIGEFKHIEFLSTPINVNAEAYDLNGDAVQVKASTYAALYYRLRLARAANIRVKALEDAAATAADATAAATPGSDADAKPRGKFDRAEVLRRKLRARSNLIYRIPNVQL